LCCASHGLRNHSAAKARTSQRHKWTGVDALGGSDM
jgi:hypothetical protein